MTLNKSAIKDLVQVSFKNLWLLIEYVELSFYTNILYWISHWHTILVDIPLQKKIEKHHIRCIILINPSHLPRAFSSI